MQQALLVCFLSALCGENSGLHIYTGAEGGSGKISCQMSLSGGGWSKFFCKDRCQGDNVLIKTDQEAANSGRFSIKYKDGSSGKGTLSVAISNLTKSDSGRYRCAVGKTEAERHTDFEIRVLDELLEGNAGFVRTSVTGETLRKSCFHRVNESSFFLCKGACKNEEDVLLQTDHRSSQSGRYSIEYSEASVFGLYVTMEHVTKADTGRYTCGYGTALTPRSSFTFNVIVVDAPIAATLTPSATPSLPGFSSTSSASPETTDQLKYKGYFLPLLVCVRLLGLMLLITVLRLLCKWKRSGSGQTRRGGADGTVTEFSVTSVNLDPIRSCEDSEADPSEPELIKTPAFLSSDL